MKQLSVISIAILTLLLFSTSAMAWSNCKTRPCNADGNQMQQENRIERMALILDLSEEQQQQMVELRATQQQKRTQMRTEFQEARQQLRAAQPGAALDTEELQAKARAFADLKAAILVNKIEHKQQMFNLLTPEQQEKAAKLRGLHPQHGNMGPYNNSNYSDTRPGPCPKSFNNGRGGNLQRDNNGMGRGMQTLCMMNCCR